NLRPDVSSAVSLATPANFGPSHCTMEYAVSRKAPPAHDLLPTATPFTLSEADITSQRAVPRRVLPGVLGASAAAAAFPHPGGAPASDHDGPSQTARSPRRRNPTDGD